MRAFALAAIIFCSASSAAVPPAIHMGGKLPSGLTYQLDIQEVPFARPAGVQAEDGSIWGVDGEFPESIVGTFILQLGGKRAYIPRKYFTDLSDVRVAKVSEVKGGTVRVWIEGSDAAGGYFGEFLFRKLRLVERTMHDGEFSNEVWEKVVLHNDTMDHPERY